MRKNSQNTQPDREERARVLREIGQYLKDLRHDRGEDLYEVGDYLRIRPAYLYALEEGNIEDTPGPTYALGFLRTYTHYLGGDVPAVVNSTRYALKGLVGEEQPAQNNPEPEKEDRRPTVQIVALSAAAALAMIVAWQVQSNDRMLPTNLADLPAEFGQTVASYIDPNYDDDVSAENAAQQQMSARASSANASGNRGDQYSAERTTPSAALLPDPDAERRLIESDQLEADTSVEEPTIARIDASSALAAEPRQIEAPNSDGTVGRPQASAVELLAALQARDDAPSGNSPSRGVPSIEGLDANSALSRTQDLNRRIALLSAEPSASNEDPVAEAQTVAVESENQSRITLVAQEETWIQVRSSSRDYVRTRTLLAGESMELPDREDLSLWTGNAGGVQIILDGKTLNKPGQSRQVIKDLPLAPLTLLETLGPAREG